MQIPPAVKCTMDSPAAHAIATRATDRFITTCGLVIVVLLAEPVGAISCPNCLCLTGNAPKRSESYYDDLFGEPTAEIERPGTSDSFESSGTSIPAQTKETPMVFIEDLNAMLVNGTQAYFDLVTGDGRKIGIDVNLFSYPDGTLGCQLLANVPVATRVLVEAHHENDIDAMLRPQTLPNQGHQAAFAWGELMPDAPEFVQDRIPHPNGPF